MDRGKKHLIVGNDKRKLHTLWITSSPVAAGPWSASEASP
uniref:Putative exonuclease, RdgC n=1 Tax=mine drainage metagenome TaxID=410659 RepID=E6QE55_9ZZZZ